MVDNGELITLIRAVDPDCIFLDDDGQTVTTEWLVGRFAGRGFVAPTLDEAVQKLCDYLDEHIGHDSIVGRIVTESGWPNLVRVKQYLKNQL